MSVDISLLLSIISICIALLAMLSSFLYLRETIFYNKESARAQITLFPRYVLETNSWELVLENFGNSSGVLLDIKTNPPLSYQNLLDPNDAYFYRNAVPITEMTNCFLASGQSFFCDFPFENYPDKIFSVTLRYKTLNKIYTESYTIDLSFHMHLMIASSGQLVGSKNMVDQIEQISKSIHILSRKF